MGGEPTPAREQIAFLVRSDCRLEILNRVADGPVTKRELKASVDAVRTTIQRNLDALEERNLIEGRDRSYELTGSGELIASQLQELLETTAVALRLGPAIEAVANASAAFELDREIAPRDLADATVVEATTEDPYAPVRRHQERLAGAERARLVLPASAPAPLETAREELESGSVHEAVVTPRLADTLRSDPAFRETFEALSGTDTVAVYRYDGDVPSFVGVLDEAVQIGVHDDRGIPAVLVESEADPVRTWAIRLFDAYRDRSERIV